MEMLENLEIGYNDRNQEIWDILGNMEEED